MRVALAHQTPSRCRGLVLWLPRPPGPMCPWMNDLGPLGVSVYSAFIKRVGRPTNLTRKIDAYQTPGDFAYSGIKTYNAWLAGSRVQN